MLYSTTCGVLGQDPKEEERESVKQRVREAIKDLKKQGVCHYQIGGSGVFTEIVMEVLKEEKGEDPFIRITQVLPCPECTFGFEESPLCEKTERIEKNADKLLFLHPTYVPDRISERDLRLISGSKYILCYFPEKEELEDYMDKDSKIVIDIAKRQSSCVNLA